MYIDDLLAHSGTPHEGWIPHSGRHPWGTGAKYDKKPGEWVKAVLDREKHIRDNYKDIIGDAKLCEKYKIRDGDSVELISAKMAGMSTDEYRKYKTIRKEEQKLIDIRKAVKMQSDGSSVADISRELDLPWSTVKTYLKPGALENSSKISVIADGLLEYLNERKYLDVGEGVERQLNISENQLGAALMMLQDAGYNVYTNIRVKQATNPSKKTTVTVLTDPDTTEDDVWEHREEIVSPKGIRFEDYGSTLQRREPFQSVDHDRIYIRYAEDGGTDKDGVIEIRPGVEDLSLGGRDYAQVRIAVDGTHYLKGMAVYGYDMPPGYDIVFNTNKHKGTPALGPKDDTVLKLLKDDPNNPFGSNTTQWHYFGENGEKLLSPVEIVNDDTDWAKWKKSLPSQVLSKQPIELARRQLNLAYLQKEQEFQEIMAIDNPTVRRQLLYDFSEACDRSAVDLKAAAMPRQATKVLLPVTSLKDDEVYAPGYEQGEEVVLIRFPHAGTFEIPRLRVNNENEEGKAVLGSHPAHAIGVNTHVTSILSGADFDGDTVLIIPTKNQNIKTSEPLEQLKDFDPKEMYRKSKDAQKTGDGDGFVKGRMMGEITNLITDMSLKGASKAGGLTEEELGEIARAVRHSMVVIDAEKHNLDWKKSWEDNQIAELKIKYQGGVRKGASTLISRAGGDGRVPERDYDIPFYKMTDDEKERWLNGEKVYRETGRTYEETYTNKKGEEKTRIKKAMTTGDKLALEPDAYNLASPYLMDTVYAEHSNRLKALANEARKEERATGTMKKNPDAEKMYADEVKSLEKKLNDAALNAPRERQAQLIANKAIKLAIERDPSLGNKKDKEAQDKLKKRRAKEIEAARAKTGAQRNPIEITEKEWNAIEAGAITDNKLVKILRYTDKAAVKKLASGRQTPALNAAKRSRARALLDYGWTQGQVAEELGVSVSTLTKELGNFIEIGGAD